MFWKRKRTIWRFILNTLSPEASLLQGSWSIHRAAKYQVSSEELPYWLCGWFTPFTPDWFCNMYPKYIPPHWAALVLKLSYVLSLSSLLSLSQVHGSFLLHSMERDSVVIWVEPRAEGSNKIRFLYLLLPLWFYMTLDKYLPPPCSPVICCWCRIGLPWCLRQ